MNNEPKVYRKNGKIIIEMPEENLIYATENSPRFDVEVKDSEAYLNAMTKELLNYTCGTDDDPALFRLFDDITENMIEEGEEFLEQRKDYY